MERDGKGRKHNVDVTGDVSRIDLAPRTGRWLVLVTVLPSGDIGEYVLPEDGNCILGRSPGCPVFVDDASVSRHHAEIAIGPGGPIIRDLDSHNGTFLNEERIGDTFVGVIQGDTLRFGSVSGQIHRVSSDPTSGRPVVPPR